MTIKIETRFKKLLSRYRRYIIAAALFSFLLIVSSLGIYFFIAESHIQQIFWHKLADLLMTLAIAILGAGLIGGGIGGTVNFIFEELKKEDEEAKEKKKALQENREKRLVFRKEMQAALQHVNNDVELARILIKSHKSGKTYGEQIRNRIMPSLISLEGVKRKLDYAGDRRLKKHLKYIHVSLNYMIAYLSVLIEEFEASYLYISDLQIYQDVLANRMRTLFTDIALGNRFEGITNEQKKAKFLESVDDLFEQAAVPERIDKVWMAMNKLTFLWDFIGDIRNKEGNESLYLQFFLNHYTHCLQLLSTKKSVVDDKIINQKAFMFNLKEYERVFKKFENEIPLTQEDNLIMAIMQEELGFDFENTNKKKP